MTVKGQVTEVERGLYVHHYAFTFINEPGTGMVVRLLGPERKVVAYNQQIPPREVDHFTMTVQAVTTHTELEVEVMRFDVWPSYPHRDLMDMARWMFPSYFRKGREYGDDDE